MAGEARRGTLKNDVFTFKRRLFRLSTSTHRSVKRHDLKLLQPSGDRETSPRVKPKLLKMAGRRDANQVSKDTTKSLIDVLV